MAHCGWSVCSDLDVVCTCTCLYMQKFPEHITYHCSVWIFVHTTCKTGLWLYMGDQMSTLVDRGWGVLDLFRALCPPFYLHIGRHSHNKIWPPSSIFTNCKPMVIGASVSEPHTSMTASNTCVDISMFVWTNHFP